MDEPDADPGDGRCEATAGEGDCTLRAAIDEANALGAANVEVSGSHALPSDGPDGHLRISSSVHMNLTSAEAASITGSIVVEPDGSLVASGVTIHGSIEVQGALILKRSELTSLELSDLQLPPALTVRPGGTALLWHSYVGGASSPAAVDNAGELTLSFVDVASADTAAIHTGEGALTSLSATKLGRFIVDDGISADPDGALCTGAAIHSGGYNHAVNETCDLSDPTDIQDGDLIEEPGGPTHYGRSWVDRIPWGELGCGELNGFDLVGNHRPIAFHPDGDEACDIGAYELPAP